MSSSDPHGVETTVLMESLRRDIAAMQTRLYEAVGFCHEAMATAWEIERRYNLQNKAQEL